ncbi:MAG: hypothetical protein F6K35_28410 [Okeania sp. SIO2H7]|nr:hypothetical protein [Okeania sp. SIO2H7]
MELDRFLGSGGIVRGPWVSSFINNQRSVKFIPKDGMLPNNDRHIRCSRNHSLRLVVNRVGKLMLKLEKRSLEGVNGSLQLRQYFF